MIHIPGYVIRNEIGRGGMATVYRAVQTSLDREVALKVMSSTMVSDPSFSRRFLQEARTLASLTHPNIVAVYDVGVTPEQSHYFSMQLLQGGDFMHRVQNGVSEKEIARVLIGVARALGFAHQRGFVHRDVAPGNILFDAADTPVLTDFGIARALTQTSRITNAGVSVGTSHYMSPEQARGGDVDGRSDIYSLGAVAFEALTGKPPYDGDDGFAIAYAHVFEPVPNLPSNLQHWQPFVNRAMAKDPKDRFVDMSEVQSMLGDVASRLGVSEAPTADQTHQTSTIGASNSIDPNTAPVISAAVSSDAATLLAGKAIPANAVPPPASPSSTPLASSASTSGSGAPMNPPPAKSIAADAPTVRAMSAIDPKLIESKQLDTKPAGTNPVDSKSPGQKLVESNLAEVKAVASDRSDPKQLESSKKAAAPMPPNSPAAKSDSSNKPDPVTNPSLATAVMAAPKTDAAAQGRQASSVNNRASAPAEDKSRSSDGVKTQSSSSQSSIMKWLLPIAAILLLGVGIWGWQQWQARQRDDTSKPIETIAAITPEKTENQGVAATATSETTPTTSTEATLPLLNSDGTPIDSQVAEATDPNAITAIDADPAQMEIDPLAELIRLAQADLRSLRLTNPPKRNAYDRYKEALKLDSTSVIAKQGVVDVANSLLKVADARLKAGKIPEALVSLNRASEIAAEFPEGKKVVEAIKAKRTSEINAAKLLADTAEKSKSWDQAIAAWQRALLFDPANAMALDAIKRLEASKNEVKVPVFAGPAVVNIELKGKRLAVARTETTLEQFRQYWNERGSKTSPNRVACRDREGVFRASKQRDWKAPGFKQSGSNPVVCITAADAVDYVRWLSEKTGQNYRLLRESEWRELARKSSVGKACGANLADQKFKAEFGERDAFDCDDGYTHAAPVGRFASGSSGVSDVAGNVREWVQCDAGGCKEYAAMGSSWMSDKNKSDLEQRETFIGDVASNTIGFRVVRDAN